MTPDQPDSSDEPSDLELPSQAGNDPLEQYQLVADTIGGVPSLRWLDTLIQTLAIVAALLIGAGIGFLLGGDRTGAILGGLAGCVAGLLISGAVLMVLGWIRAAKKLRRK